MWVLPKERPRNLRWYWLPCPDAFCFSGPLKSSALPSLNCSGDQMPFPPLWLHYLPSVPWCPSPEADVGDFPSGFMELANGESQSRGTGGRQGVRCCQDDTPSRRIPGAWYSPQNHVSAGDCGWQKLCCTWTLAFCPVYTSIKNAWINHLLHPWLLLESWDFRVISSNLRKTRSRT